VSTVGTPDDPDRAPCEHCPDGHTDPRTVPWGVRLATDEHGDVVVDSDGQPTHLIVERTQGSHVAQADADWLWQLIRDHG
jgi:hypothetical protein